MFHLVFNGKPPDQNQGRIPERPPRYLTEITLKENRVWYDGSGHYMRLVHLKTGHFAEKYLTSYTVLFFLSPEPLQIYHEVLSYVLY